MIKGLLFCSETSPLSFYRLCFGFYFISCCLILFWSQQFIKIMNDWVSFYSSAGSNLETLFINRTYRKDRIVLLYQQVGSRYASIGVVFHCFQKNCGGFSLCTNYNKTIVRIFIIVFVYHRVPTCRIQNWKRKQHALLLNLVTIVYQYFAS